MNADDLSRRIVVRHREAGYLRLELPAGIAHAAAGAALEQGLRAVPGVYRVSFYPGERRLAVRHDEHACTAADVARALKALLPGLPPASAASAASAEAPAAAPRAASPGGALQDVAAAARNAFAGLRARIDGLAGPGAPAGSLQARLQPVLANAMTEQAVTNFLNDLVAFYLIKVHWELITQRWLKDPVKHADAWLTTFYLVFLLVRYRKKIAKGAATPAPAAVPPPAAGT